MYYLKDRSYKTILRLVPIGVHKKTRQKTKEKIIEKDV